MSNTMIWPFKINNIGVIDNDESEQAAIESFLSFLFSLRENEILGEPDLFCRLHLLVFETNKAILDSMSRLYIEEAIDKYASDIVRIKDFYGTIEDRIYSMYITYEVISSGEEFSKTFSLQLIQ